MGEYTLDCTCCRRATGTVNCCFNELLSSCYRFNLGGLADNAGSCRGLLCGLLNDTYTMSWVTGCTWRSPEKVIGLCEGCGDSVKAQMNVSNSTIFDPCGANKCQILVVITQDVADDSCFDYGITYRGCFAKTVDPLQPLVLDFLTASSECAGYPPTITLEPCA